MSASAHEPNKDFTELLKLRAAELLVLVEAGNIDGAVGVLIELQHARTPDINSSQDLLSMLKEKALVLHEHIAAGQLDEAMHTLVELQNARDKGLYQEIGKLTRALHNAITNFHVDGEEGKDIKDISHMSDATDRLSYVVQLTDKAANKTLDVVEDSLPIVDRVKDETLRLKSQWQRLVARDMNAEEFRALYWQLDDFFKKLDSDTSQLSSNMTEILMAQDFQDLTGQVINKITGLVKEVEASLVDLVFIAGQVEQITGIVTKGEEKNSAADMNMKGHGPQIDSSKAEVMASQDDVDDLLSSLGF